MFAYLNELMKFSKYHLHDHMNHRWFSVYLDMVNVEFLTRNNSIVLMVELFSLLQRHYDMLLFLRRTYWTPSWLQQYWSFKRLLLFIVNLYAFNAKVYCFLLCAYRLFLIFFPFYWIDVYIWKRSSSSTSMLLLHFLPSLLNPSFKE